MSELKELPKGWRWATLADKTIVTLLMGQSPPSESYNKTGEGLPFYQGKADFGELYPTPTVWCKEPKQIAETGDILLSVRAPVGPTNIANQRCCIGRGLAAIRCHQAVDKSYLLMVLRYLESQIAAEGEGSTFPAISKNDLKAVVFPLPQLAEQEAIASCLSRQMEEIERMRRVAERELKAINALPKAYLREVFGIFEPPELDERPDIDDEAEEWEEEDEQED